MKTFFLSLVTMAFMMSFYSNQNAEATNNTITIEATVAPQGSFKILNDTGSKISIYTGSGYVTLNNGSSTSVSCNTGKKVYTASKGSKDDFIFEIKSSMCGKTVKLSDYL
ncbi:hypothetical protein [Bernardetia sp.]|uniref:hypothetical protein n=1 Tax=Bernardetia sp. TaxID=1937974 RepID=UPI0025BB63A4|nr:hypothetical protein [Bernardetia sp.]